MGDVTARVRARVLDAAVQCLAAGGFGSDRLHSSISKLAGLSRPTVYKYVGDQDAIIDALIERELTVFIERLHPVLEQRQPHGQQIVNIIVFVVQYAREHPLLSGAADVPEKVLPWCRARRARGIPLLPPLHRRR